MTTLTTPPKISTVIYQEVQIGVLFRRQVQVEWALTTTSSRGDGEECDTKAHDDVQGRHRTTTTGSDLDSVQGRQHHATIRRAAATVLHTASLRLLLHVDAHEQYLLRRSLLLRVLIRSFKSMTHLSLMEIPESLQRHPTLLPILLLLLLFNSQTLEQTYRQK